MSILTNKPTQSGTGFLSFNKMPPRLHIAGDDPEFDPVTIKHWQEEGFHVTYHGLNPDDLSGFIATLKGLPDDLELGEAYALVAYGAAASHALSLHIKPQPHLCALIAYYPDQIVHPNASYPSSLHVVTHIAGSQAFSSQFKSYRYQGTKPGFAEWDLDDFDRVAAGLSWTRSLRAVRRGFGTEVDIEPVVDEKTSAVYLQKDVPSIRRTLGSDVSHTNIPTLTGGTDLPTLTSYYTSTFLPGIPQNLSMRLISRTIGTDRIVDEIHVSFRHTQRMDWILPNIEPTNKKVEIMLVNSVAVRGGKVVQERCYWDQASVLVQVGLLDPKIVPGGFQGLERVPCVGREGARRVLDERSVPLNALIGGGDSEEGREVGEADEAVVE